MFNIILSLIMLLTTSMTFASNKVKHVSVKRDQIVTVRTSLGIATIIEVPDRPNSVVVGDQDSFKVEYLDQAITIKPLSPGAKSNLYVYTDYARYNVELVTGDESISDYVVYLEHSKKKEERAKSKQKIAWTKFSNYLRNNSLRLEVVRLGRASSDVLMVEFIISSVKSDVLKPEWIWLTQNGSTIPIHNLFFSHVEIAPNKPVKGTIQLLKKDLNPDEPIRLEFRRIKNSYLTVKKVNLWK